MIWQVGLLGLGTVGAGTAAILCDPAGRHPLLEKLHLRAVGVRHLHKPRHLSLAPGILTTHLESIVTDPEIHIVVELLGGLEPARTLILTALHQGKHVVTANKAVIAHHGAEIFTAATAAGRYVLIEGAVGGGIPIIQPLKQALGANRLHTVMGIVNGTTNYILSRMAQEGADFAAVLQDAQRLGYAEADPTADVDGWDAADKIAILASLAFGERVKREAVVCEGIRAVTATDIAYAERLGYVIKLLALAYQRPAGLDIRVHPTLVPQAHPLASVNGVNNAILVGGDPLGEVMLEGPGAGAGPTSSAVVGDILTAAAALEAGLGFHPLLSCSHEGFAATLPLAQIASRFYVRLLSHDEPGVIGQLGTCFGRHAVSLESIVQIGHQEGLAEIVVITHEVNHGQLQAALEDIRGLAALQSVPSLLRVL